MIYIVIIMKKGSGNGNLFLLWYAQIYLNKLDCFLLFLKNLSIFLKTYV